MTVKILAGASGKWQAVVAGVRVWGHIPRTLWWQGGWEAVCLRQISRQLAGEPPRMYHPGLRGGAVYWLEVPGALLRRAEQVAQAS